MWVVCVDAYAVDWVVRGFSNRDGAGASKDVGEVAVLAELQPYSVLEVPPRRAHLRSYEAACVVLREQEVCCLALDLRGSVVGQGCRKPYVVVVWALPSVVVWEGMLCKSVFVAHF